MSDNTRDNDEEIVASPVFFDVIKRIKKIESIINLNNVKYDVSKEIHLAIKSRNCEKLIKLIDECPHRFTLSQLSNTLQIFIKHNHIEGATSILTHTRLTPWEINYCCRMAMEKNKPNIVVLFLRLLPCHLNINTQQTLLIKLIEHNHPDLLSMFFKKFLGLEQKYTELAILEAVKVGNIACVRILFKHNKIRLASEFLDKVVEESLTYAQDNMLSYFLECQIHLFTEETIQSLVINAYKNNCIKTVNLLGENFPHLITSTTRGKLLFLSIENNDHNLMRSLLDTEIDSLERQLAYQTIFALADTDASFLTFQPNQPVIKLLKNEEEMAFEEETIDVLTFMFTQFTIKESKAIDQLFAKNSLCLLTPRAVLS